MANKTALVVLGVIVFASIGVGVLVGTQMGEGEPEQTSNPGSTSSPAEETTEEPTPVPTVSETTNMSGTTTDEVTTTSPETTTIAVRRFDESEIVSEIKQQVNEERTARGREPLSTGGTTSNTLDEMATSHSVTMADEADLGHNVDGTTSKQRYEQYGVFESCSFLSASGGKIIDAERDRLEVLGQTVAGRPYEDPYGDEQFHKNETAVANDIVRGWFKSGIFSDRLVYENADHIGVGVEITKDGDVYVTGNVC